MRAMTNRLPTDSQSRAMPRPRRIVLGMELEQEFTRKGGPGTLFELDCRKIAQRQIRDGLDWDYYRWAN
jgi:hypothetical protein